MGEPQLNPEQVASEIEQLKQEQLRDTLQTVSTEQHNLEETMNALEHLISLYEEIQTQHGILPRHAAQHRRTALQVIKRDLEHIQ